MKKMIFTLVTMLTLALNTNAMSYEQARNEALFLTDKMAYELNLTDAQYEAAYEINLDYLMSITGYDDVAGIWWERRNQDLRYILYSWQWDAFCAATYFYRPLYWEAGYWHFGVYARYPRRTYFFFGTPHFYATYRGGHSWRMNGGRSFYEHRRDHFRPGHVERSNHVGMRTGWDRGDYRGRTHGNSSTRITAGGHSGRVTNGGRPGERMDNRHNNDRSREGMGTRPNSGNRESMGTRPNSNRNFGGSRDNSTRPSSSMGSSHSPRHSSGSSSSTPSRSFGGSHTPSSSHSSSGSFSGSRGSSHSIGGGHSGGGPTRSSGGSHGGRSGSSRR